MGNLQIKNELNIARFPHTPKVTYTLWSFLRPWLCEAIGLWSDAITMNEQVWYVRYFYHSKTSLYITRLFAMKWTFDDAIVAELSKLNIHVLKQEQ